MGGSADVALELGIRGVVDLVISGVHGVEVGNAREQVIERGMGQRRDGGCAGGGRFLHEATGHCLDPPSSLRLDPLTKLRLNPLTPSSQVHARAHGHPCRAEGLGLEGNAAMHIGKCGINRLFHAIIDG